MNFFNVNIAAFAKKLHKTLNMMHKSIKYEKILDKFLFMLIISMCKN